MDEGCHISCNVHGCEDSRISVSLPIPRGPVWVYVLERQHAIKVLKTLMGNEDPELVRQSNANSLCALYGTSKNDNAFIGSPDTTTTKDQISILFASSLPFQATVLPDSPLFAAQTGSLCSITSSILSALNHNNSDKGHEASSSQSPISGKGWSMAGGSSRDRSRSSGFRVCPVPASITTPQIQPCLSRATVLHAGIVQPNISVWYKGPHQALSKEELQGVLQTRAWRHS